MSVGVDETLNIVTGALLSVLRPALTALVYCLQVSGVAALGACHHGNKRWPTFEGGCPFGSQVQNGPKQSSPAGFLSSS